MRTEWVEALRLAPTLKQDFYTVLSRDGSRERAIALLEEDARLVRCFVGRIAD